MRSACLNQCVDSLFPPQTSLTSTLLPRSFHHTRAILHKHQWSKTDNRVTAILTIHTVGPSSGVDTVELLNWSQSLGLSTPFVPYTLLVQNAYVTISHSVRLLCKHRILSASSLSKLSSTYAKSVSSSPGISSTTVQSFICKAWHPPWSKMEGRNGAPWM